MVRKSARHPPADAGALRPTDTLDTQVIRFIRQSQPIVDRQFEIELLEPGVKAFVFTFG